MVPSKDLKWHVVYTRPKLERKVVACISNLGFESYLPLHKVVRQWSDRRKKMEVPLFPNYVFVKVNGMGYNSLHSIKEIVRFVSIDRRPVVIREDEIKMIKRLLMGEPDVASEEYFQEGARIRIEHGQFAGLEGIVVKQNNKSRLIVKIDGIMRAFSVNISLNTFEIVHA